MPELEQSEPNTPDVDIQEEAVEAAPDPSPEPDRRAPGPVPYEVFRDTNERLRALEAQNSHYQALLLQAQQRMYEANQPRQPEPEIDPGVEELVRPVVGKYLAPLQNELQAVRQRESVLLAERQAKAAWDYVRDNVPDFDDLTGDIQTYLDSLPKSRQDKITSDPDLVIQTAELVRERKAAGRAISTKAAKEDLKARSKGDSGSASIPLRPSNNVDWSKLSDAEFREMERKLGIR